MSIHEALERTCEVYIAKKFEEFIEAVSAADNNEEVIAIAAKDFRAGVQTGKKVLAEAKQIVEE